MTLLTSRHNCTSKREVLGSTPNGGFLSQIFICYMHIDIFNQSQIINTILLLNGIYDILCSAGILWFSNIPGFSELSKLHTGMFSKESDRENPVIRRLLAYWLMTYGMVRLAASLSQTRPLYIVAAMTYFIEAGCFEYENRVGETLISTKVAFVSILSIVFGVLVFWKTLYQTDHP